VRRLTVRGARRELGSRAHVYGYQQANPFWRLMRRSGAWPGVRQFYVHTLHHLDRLTYRITRGRSTLVSLVTGLPIMFLTTTGRRSGIPRTLPLVAIPGGDTMIVIASNYGQREHPAWYHNLKANPRVTATLDGVTREMAARELDGEERDRWYERGIEIYPGWISYRRRTAAHRLIPVIELRPASQPGAAGPARAVAGDVQP
jgi:deazaflavin-dependent oxidoreductase (nitroreductase family)